mgnify:CR=1 FL=1
MFYTIIIKINYRFRQCLNWARENKLDMIMLFGLFVFIFLLTMEIIQGGVAMKLASDLFDVLFVEVLST